MIQYVQFFPTYRCNRACKFCFNRGLGSLDFPEEKIEVILNILKENNIYNLDILGGEPFLYDGLNSLVEKAVKKDIIVTISTNGSLLNKLREFIYLLGGTNFHIGVSLNDKISDDLLSLIVEHRLWIKSVIRRRQYVKEEIIGLARSLNLRYYLIFMDAVNKSNLAETVPFYEFMNFVEKIKGDYDFEGVFPVYCKGFIDSNKVYRCPAGTEKISIMPNGDVYPCYLFFRLRGFCLGNIFSDPLERILTSPRLNFFKEFKGNLCINKNCAFYKACNGGCPAHSLIHYGNLKALEPRCFKGL